MENNHTALREAFNREIVTLLRFLLEGTDLHNPASELESSISLDEIASNSHWLKGKRVKLARKAGRITPEDGAART